MLRRWRIKAAVAAVALYTVFGFFVVPWIARSQITKLSRTFLHREARVERVRFNPFTLVTDIHGLALDDRDGTKLFGAERVVVDFEVSGIFKRAWRFRNVELDRPRVAVRILSDGRPSIADLFVAAEPKAEATPKKPLPRILVDRLALQQGEVQFVDESRSPPFKETLAPIDLGVHALTTIPAAAGDHAIAVALGEKTRIHWSGRQTVEPLRLEGTLDVTGVPIPEAWQYIAPAHPLEIRDGSADAHWAYVVDRGSDEGLTITISDGRVAVHRLVVWPRGGNEEWLRVPELAVSSINAAWPDSTAEIGEVRVTEPHALVSLEKGPRVNWQGALPTEGPTPIKSSIKAIKPWSWKVGLLDVAKASAVLEDRTASPPVSLALEATDVHAERLSSDFSAAVPVRASVHVRQGGDLTADGTVIPDPLAADVRVAVKALELPPFASYVRIPNVELKQGAFSVDGRARIAPSPPRLRFEGQASIERVTVVDRDAAPLIGCPRADARGIQLTVLPEKLRIANIDVDGAFARIYIDRDGKLNLKRVGSSAESTEGAAAASAEPPPKHEIPAIDIGTITLRNAKADYTDESLILPFGTEIHDAGGVIKDLSTRSAAPARLDVEGRATDIGYLKAGGTLRVADPFASSDVNVTFRNVTMSNLTPYVAQFAGYRVNDGKLDVDVHYRFQDHRIVGDHRIVANNLVLGDKVEGSKAPSVPLKLAVALLKDKDGKIDLEVPIEGSVDAPEFAYGKVFWQALHKVFAHVVTAPFRAIGRMFGKQDEDLDLVGFVSGRSDLIAPEQETLARLAGELSKRPELSIEVSGKFDPVADPAAIRTAALEKRIDAKRESVDSQEAILEALFTESFSKERLDTVRAKFTPPAPAGAFDAAGFYDDLRVELLAAEPVGDAQLGELARARAAAIVAALTAEGGVDPAKVKASDPSPVKRKKQGSDLVASEMTLSAGD